jgi:diguanylate cyclase (GGDEF)-like protein
MNRSVGNKSVVPVKMSLMRLNSGQKLLLCGIAIAFFLSVLWADILLLSTQIQLIVPYLIVVCATTLFIGTRTGFLFSMLSVLFWFSSKTRNFSDLTPATYADLGIKSAFVFVLFLLMRYARKIFQENEQLSLTDELTRMHNRRGFLYLAGFELQRQKRTQHFLSVLFIDIDDFKTVNDTLGHRIGDAVLKEFSEVVRKCTQPGDLSARIGGDEFCLLLPDTEPEKTRRITEQIVRDFRKVSERNKWDTTLSIGVYSTTFRNHIHTMLAKADNLMYLAKKKGKNQVVEAIDS